MCDAMQSTVLPWQVISCLVPVIGASGYSGDIAISSWTLSRYRDQRKVHDSSPSAFSEVQSPSSALTVWGG